MVLAMDPPINPSPIKPIFSGFISRCPFLNQEIAFYLFYHIGNWQKSQHFVTLK
jgi:hypothetical protein